MSIKQLLLFSIFIASGSLTLSHETLSNTGQSKTLLNAIHSEEVQQIMRRLRLLFYEREYTAHKIQELSNEQIVLLAEEAATLASTATNLPKIESLKDMNDEDQLTFNALANQLSKLTLELKTLNEANHQVDLVPTYIKLQDTCNTCHKLFRNY